MTVRVRVGVRVRVRVRVGVVKAEEVLPVLPVHGLEVNAKLLPEQPRALQEYRVVCR